jgi:hypothetical protein
LRRGCSSRAPPSKARKKYSATLIFPKSARPEMEKQVAEVIRVEWKDAGIERAKKGLIKSPFLAGDGKEARNKSTGDLRPGMGAEFFFIRVQAGEERPPAVWFRDPNRHETEEVVYSGCYGNAIVNIFAWHNAQSGDGVSFGISGFQKLQDGERLGGSGRIDPEKWSETIADEGPAPNVGGGGASSLFGD